MADYVDVFTDCQQRIESVFSISKYMGDINKWDRIVSQLPSLTVAGKKAISLDGRVDILSFQIYGDPMLDWILLLYNRISHIADESVNNVQKTLHVEINPGSTRIFDIKVKAFNETPASVFTYIDGSGNSVALPVLSSGSYTYVTIGAMTEAITFKPRQDGGTDIKNNTTSIQAFQITYSEAVEDDSLKAGHVLYYPSYDDVESLLQETTTAVDSDTTGFARL